jgi:hypothetical protein
MCPRRTTRRAVLNGDHGSVDRAALCEQHDPANRIDSVAAKMIQFWPDPHDSRPRSASPPARAAASTGGRCAGKIDFKTGPNSRWSGRFMYDDQPYLVTNAIDFFTRTDVLTNWAQNLTNTRTFGTKVVNEWASLVPATVLPGFQHCPCRTTPSSLGIPNWPLKTVDQTGVPRVSITNLLPIGDGGNYGPVPEGNWEVKDNISWTQGSTCSRPGTTSGCSSSPSCSKPGRPSTHQ